MFRTIRSVCVAAVLIVSGNEIQAAEPISEDLPPPRQAGPASTPAIAPLPMDSGFPAYQRTSRYDVWQFYGVDRHGFFKPRVIYSPAGAYYLYNGEPYGYTSTRQLDFMPYAYE